MLAPDQSHSYRLLSRHSFFFAFLIATFALTAGFRFETQEFSNLQDQMGKGLEPIQRPPNGVKITSTDRSLTVSIEKSEKDPGKDSSREFFLIFPPSASLVPEIADFQIILNDQAPKPSSSRHDSIAHACRQAATCHSEAAAR